MKFEKLKKLWLPMFIFGAVLIIFYKTVDRLPEVLSGILNFLGIFSPIVTAAIIAFLLYIPQNAIEKLFLKLKKENFFHKHSRGISVGITYILILAAVAAILYFVLPAVVKSVASLVTNLPEYYANTIAYIKDLGGQDGKIWGFDVSEIEKLVSLEQVLNYFDFSSFGKYAAEIAKVGSGFFDFVISVVMSVYMLCSHERIILTGGRILNLVFKQKTLYSFYSYVARGCEIFYDYLYGAFLDAILVGIILAIALTVAGVPYGILLGIFVGLCNLIPYFGAIISGAVAAVITYITTGDILKALICIAIIIVIQQIDGNLIQPRIVGKSVGVKPFYVLVAITLGGALFGFIGILISVPMAAFIKMVIIDIFAAKKEKQMQLKKAEKGE